MGKNSGYIKLYRDVKNWKHYKYPFAFHVFLYLIAEARIKDSKVDGIPVMRGQLITTIKEISEDTGVSVRSVRTILDKLCVTKELTKVSTKGLTKRHTIITICKYDTYQYENLDTDKGTDKGFDKESDISYLSNTLSNKEECLKECNKEEKDILTYIQRVRSLYPRVMSMQKPLTYDECEKLGESGYTTAEINGVLGEMENWAKLYEKVSAYRTSLNWLQRKYGMRKKKEENGKNR